MRDLLAALADPRPPRTRLAVATVIGSTSSAPRRSGTVLAVAPDGTIHGSLNAGCVEAAVVGRCDAVLHSGRPERLRYGGDDRSAWDAAPVCGDLEVFVRRVEPGTLPVVTHATVDAAELPMVLVTVLDAAQEHDAVGQHIVLASGRASGPLAGSRYGTALAERLAGGSLGDAVGVQSLLLDSGAGRTRFEVFIERLNARPTLLLVGADAVAAPLATFGRALGYRVLVCDPRARFTTPARFPDADEVLVAWPHRYIDEVGLAGDAAVCVLSHDARIDVPVLERALRSEAWFVGAMGSRATHQSRLERLRSAGVDEHALAQLRSPIGLDLQGNLPEEVASSIAAELVSERHGGSGRALSSLRGSLHRQRAVHVAS